MKGRGKRKLEKNQTARKTGPNWLNNNLPRNLKSSRKEKERLTRISQ
jgi:hypothetical protein